MTGKYEIDVDLADEDLSSAMDVQEQDSSVQIRSAVVKKKGRGFSSADAVKGFDGVSQFEMLEEANVGQAQKSVEGWVIFITGLHEECAEEDLYDKFADFGPIKDIKMPLDHRTGYVKGYGVIEYGTHQEAKAAIDNMNGQQMMEQEIRCDFAFVRGSSHSHQAHHHHRQEEASTRPREPRGDGSGRHVLVYNDI